MSADRDTMEIGRIAALIRAGGIPYPLHKIDWNKVNVRLCEDSSADYISGRINGKTFVFLVGSWRPARFGLIDDTTITICSPPWWKRVISALLRKIELIDGEKT